MQTKTKISTGQFFVILLLSRIMHVMVYRVETFTSGTPLMLGLVFSTLIESALGIPVFVFLIKREDVLQSVMQNKKLYLAIKIILALYFTFVSGVTLLSFARFMSEEFTFVASPVLIIVLLALSGAYCARLGIEGLARAGAPILWIFILLTVLMAFVNEGRYDTLNIIPVQKNDYKMMLDYVVWDVCACRWLVLSVALARYLKHGSQKAVIGYVFVKFILIEAVLLLITMIMWTFADVPGYPILALGIYSKTDVIHRFDAFNMLVFAINCVVINGIYLNIASDFTKKRTALHVLVPAALAAGFAVLCYKKIILMTVDVQNVITFSGIVLLGVLCPLAAIIYWRVKRKCEGLPASL